MMRKCTVAKGMLLSALLLAVVPARPLAAQGAQPAQQQPTYTIPEYNAYQACRAVTNAQARLKCLDDFVVKFPNSTLMPYIYQLYYPAYNELKDFLKTIEYADKLVALGDKVDLGTRLQALYIRSLASLNLNEKAPDAQDQLKKAREAALEGIKVLNALPKPQNMTDAQFADQKKVPAAVFNYTAGFAALGLKDYAAAIDSFKAALANNPNDGVTYFRLGVAYLGMNPPQYMDGFWSLARAIALKGPGEAQVRDYLRKRILAYEQPGCDSLVDSQMNELLQLSAGSAERPATYSIPSSADLDKTRQASTILTVLSDLQAGGDKAKMTWLALCGSEFPEVVGKVIDVTPSPDSVELHLITAATPDEMEKGTTPNMDVKIVGQSDAARLQKNDGVRFSGTLVSYDAQPFMLHWDKAKVNPEDIPAAEPGKRRPHNVPRKPGN